MVAATPSSVDTSATTGTIDNPCSSSGATFVSIFSRERLTATTVAPASREHARRVCADAAARGAGDDDDAAVEIYELFFHCSLSLL